MPKAKAADFIGTAEAARELGIIPRRVRALITAGRLPATKVASDYIILRTDLDKVRVRKPGWTAGVPRGPRRRTDAQVVADEDKKAATRERRRREAQRGTRLKKGTLAAFLKLRQEGRPAGRRTRSVAALAVMRETAHKNDTRDRLEQIIQRYK